MTDELNASDLEISVPQSPGGQQVGTRSWIQVKHNPSNITVIVDSDRSQHRNLAIAKDAILGALTSPHYRGSR